MLNKFTILFALALVGCSQSQIEHKETTAMSDAMAVAETVSLPDGFSIVEQHPQGYFIRVASPERASIGTIQAIATALAGNFDRIDFCLVAANERGDEYASVIDGKLFDYDNDIITALR